MARSSIAARIIVIVEITCLIAFPAGRAAGEEFPSRDLVSGRVDVKAESDRAQSARALIEQHLRDQGVDSTRLESLIVSLSDEDAIQFARYPSTLESGEGIGVGVSILIIVVVLVIFFELVNEDIGLSSLETKRQVMARLGELPWAPLGQHEVSLSPTSHKPQFDH